MALVGGGGGLGRNCRSRPGGRAGAGKAAAFGYAVIVSLAANFTIDIARTPADNLLHAAGLLSPAGKTVEARAVLPRAAAPSAAATDRPGPGSGGLY